MPSFVNAGEIDTVQKLNGNTQSEYTFSGEYKNICLLIEAGDVTINAEGATFTTEEYSTIWVCPGASVTINGGTYNCNTPDDYASAAIYNNGGTVTINAGTFNGNLKNYAIRNCSGTITVNAGTFYGESATAESECGGTLNINGGVWSSNGKATVDGVEYTYLLESADLGHGAGDGIINVKGGQFPAGYDLANVIKAVGEYPNTTNTLVSATLAEGYVYDTTTGKVACSHANCTEHKEVAATYEATGTKAYWSCNECSKLFEDEAATKEITDKSSLVIAKLVKTEENDTKNVVENEVVEDEKDETPKTGIVSTMTVFTTIAVISLAGLAVMKKRK